MAKLEVSIRLRQEPSVDIEGVVAELEKAGLSNASVSRRFSIVHGEIDEKRQDELRRVSGVASVRASQTFKALD